MQIHIPNTTLICKTATGFGYRIYQSSGSTYNHKQEKELQHSTIKLQGRDLVLHHGIVV